MHKHATASRLTELRAILQRPARPTAFRRRGFPWRMQQPTSVDRVAEDGQSDVAKKIAKLQAGKTTSAPTSSNRWQIEGVGFQVIWVTHGGVACVVLCT